MEIYKRKRLGSLCTINGRNTYDIYNADLIKYYTGSGSINAVYDRGVSLSDIHVSSYSVGIGTLTAEFYVGGDTKNQMQINASNLVSDARTCVFETDEESFEYDAVLTKFNIEETGIMWYNKVSLEFAVVKRLPLVTRRFETVTNNQVQFKNVGNIESGLRLSITPRAAKTSIKVAGITIKNLLAGQPFVIDGLDGTIICNTENRFLDTDLTSFPHVSVGNNTIITDTNDVIIEVQYYPTFIV